MVWPLDMENGMGPEYGKWYGPWIWKMIWALDIENGIGPGYGKWYGPWIWKMVWKMGPGFYALYLDLDPGCYTSYLGPGFYTLYPCTAHPPSPDGISKLGFQETRPYFTSAE
jgi:hypothetical protein